MDLTAVLAAAEKVAGKYKPKPDAVRWTAWKEDGTEIGRWKHTACYSQIMSTLPQLEIHCLPWGGPSKGQMPALWYYYFFRLLKKAGLVPPEVKTLCRQGAHCLIIPRTGWDRHTLYITLCYYRHCDQKPNEVMKAMLLYKRLAPQGTRFLQVMHYLAATTAFGSGHSFLAFGPYGGADKLDLANGQALAWFARLSKEERLETCPLEQANKKQAYDSHYTYVLLAERAKEMESLKVRRVSDILDPQYAKYYENPGPARK